MSLRAIAEPPKVINLMEALKRRTGLDWTHKYPAIAVAALPATQAYLDGELWPGADLFRRGRGIQGRGRTRRRRKGDSNPRSLSRRCHLISRGGEGAAGRIRVVKKGA